LGPLWQAAARKARPTLWAVGRRPTLSLERLRRARVAAQLLHKPRRSNAVEVVRHLLGVQAQLGRAATLALAARTDGLTPEVIERARVEDRDIVVNWAMRGTLHLVAAQDHGWLLPLMLAPRIANSRRRAYALGLKANPDQAVQAVVRMLEREGPLTRQQILERLRRRRLGEINEGVIYHLLFLTTAAGDVCYGPNRGKDRCLVLVRDWLGATEAMERDAALAELAVRYLAAHGPATPEDLAFWSGLGLGDARRGWRAIEERLVEVRTKGTTLWTLRSSPGESPAGVVRLLPNFDEYVLGWMDRGFAVTPDRWKAINRGAGWIHPVVLADGRMVGVWKGKRASESLRLVGAGCGPLSPAGRRRVVAEGAATAAFQGASAEVSFG
jgi:hypothetical protein